MSVENEELQEYRDLEGTLGRPISQQDLDSFAGEPFPFPKKDDDTEAQSAKEKPQETFKFSLDDVFNDPPNGRKRGSDVDLDPVQWGDKKPRKSLGEGKSKGKGKLYRGDSKDYQKKRNQTLSNYISQLHDLIFMYEDGDKGAKKSKKKKIFKSKTDILKVS